MKKILQIDGGGIRGILPAGVLEHLEKQCGQPLGQCFDLITGTSTGAIIGGMIAAGVPAQEINALYINKGRKLFSRRSLLNPINLVRSKYDRRPFMEEMEKLQVKNLANKIIPLSQLKLADLTPRFMATAFNLSSQRTHFIKSWEGKDQLHRLVDIIAWSALSGAYYFGKINVAEFAWKNYPSNDLTSPPEDKKGAVFQDGGQGAHHNTLGYILTEVLANRWIQEEIYILSLGTGQQREYVPYEIAAKFHLLEQIKLYFLCQARRESINNQVLATHYVSHATKEHPRILFKRIDKNLDEAETGLDNVEYIERYQEDSDELKGKIQPEDIDLLRR